MYDASASDDCVQVESPEETINRHLKGHYRQVTLIKFVAAFRHDYGLRLSSHQSKKYTCTCESDPRSTEHCINLDGRTYTRATTLALEKQMKFRANAFAMDTKGINPAMSEMIVKHGFG